MKSETDTLKPHEGRQDAPRPAAEPTRDLCPLADRIQGCVRQTENLAMGGQLRLLHGRAARAGDSPDAARAIHLSRRAVRENDAAGFPDRARRNRAVTRRTGPTHCRCCFGRGIKWIAGDGLNNPASEPPAAAAASEKTSGEAACILSAPKSEPRKKRRRKAARDVLARTGNVTEAARAAKVTREPRWRAGLKKQARNRALTRGMSAHPLAIFWKLDTLEELNSYTDNPVPEPPAATEVSEETSGEAARALSTPQMEPRKKRRRKVALDVPARTGNGPLVCRPLGNACPLGKIGIVTASAGRSRKNPDLFRSRSVSENLHD